MKPTPCPYLIVQVRGLLAVAAIIVAVGWQGLLLLLLLDLVLLALIDKVGVKAVRESQHASIVVLRLGAKIVSKPGGHLFQS